MVDLERLRDLARQLDASPVEALGLLVLLAGAVVATGLLWWTTPHATREAAGPPPAPVTPTPTRTTPAVVTLHVTGAVAAPGVVSVAGGSRVADAITAAGGPLPTGDVGALNLAREVLDGERIAVPEHGAPASATTPAPGAGAATTADGRIDLNAATATQLEELPGIGPVLAERIVAHRDEHGPFTEVDQLRDVRGIGERTFQELADLVVVR